MRKTLLTVLAVAALLAGCANVTKVGGGDAVIADRLVVPSDAAWNQFNPPFVQGKAAAMWTQEGLTIDQVNFYAGLKDGEELAPAQTKEQRVRVEQLAALTQQADTRIQQPVFQHKGGTQ